MELQEDERGVVDVEPLEGEAVKVVDVDPVEGEAVEVVRQIEEGDVEGGRGVNMEGGRGVNMEGGRGVALEWQNILQKKSVLHKLCDVFCLGHHLTGNPPT